MSSEEEKRRFTYRHVEDVIAAIHGTGAGPTALLGRFKYFQRLGFPGGSNTGRGSRVEYGIDQILALALAFELLETGMPPIRVVRIVRTSWQQVAPALAVEWARSSDGAEGLERVVLAMAPAALEEMGVAEDAGARSPDALLVRSIKDVTNWLQSGTVEGAPSLILVDPGRIVGTVCRELGGILALDGAATSLDGAFREWGGSLFGSPDSTRWSYASGDTSV